MNNLTELNKLDVDDGLFEQEAASSENDESRVVRPYDPNLIRVEPKMFSLRNIMDMIDEQDLDLAPDFQRLQVWKPWQKSRLIESLLLRIPLPAFYFASDAEGRLQVVDGVQRLSTIYDFVRGKIGRRFRLTNLEYLSNELEGKGFEDLKNTIWAKRIYSTQIVTNVIDPQTPLRVKFDIFKRINTGGTPLNAQEIRHCMSGVASRKLLAELSCTPEFTRVTNGKLTKHVRMEDRQMVLRVIALFLKGIDGYLASDSMDDFLNNTAQEIDQGIYNNQLKEVENKFVSAMGVAYKIFGVHAFRKWPLYETRLFPINKAIFEALGAVLCKVDATAVLKRKEQIVENYRLLCSEDPVFLQSVSQATADPVNVVERYTKFTELIG